MPLGNEQTPSQLMSAGDTDMPCPLYRRCVGGVVAVAAYSGWLYRRLSWLQPGDATGERGLAAVVASPVRPLNWRYSPIYIVMYGSVLVSWCAKNPAYPNCSGRVITTPEDLELIRKNYNCYGRLITVPKDLKLLRNTFVTAPEHFRNCSGALS